MKRRLRVPVLVLLAALLSTGTVEAGRRVVAVGDVHGAFAAFHAILFQAGLVDDEGHWTGGDAVLVQTGDLLDRGADALRVVEWLMELQEDARGQGGEVIALLGNHEAMNLLGDAREVTPEILLYLADRDSEKRRREMCKARTKIIRATAKAEGQDAPPAYALREVCEKNHPLGWVEYFAALGPDQTLGRWLRARPIAVRVGETVFVHGGLSPVEAGRGLVEVNANAHRELETFDAYRRWLVENEKMVPSAKLEEVARAAYFSGTPVEEDAPEDGASVQRRLPEPIADFFDFNDWSILRPDGPLWFRGYANWSDEELAAEMPAILDALGAKRVVVGHTPRDSAEIERRAGGGVYLIDTGMLADVYGGVPSALEIEDGRVTAVYLEHEVVLEEPERSTAGDQDVELLEHEVGAVGGPL